MSKEEKKFEDEQKKVKLATPKTVTFNLNMINLIEKDGEDFLINPKAEEGIIKWLEFKRQIDEVDKIVREKVGENMRKMKCLKVEGDQIVVSRRYFGNKYEIVDRKIADELGFTKVTETVRPDSEEIERYVKDTGELPEGVKLKERTESVIFSETKE